MSHFSARIQGLFLVAVLALLGCGSAFAQSNTGIIDLADGTSVTVTPKFNKAIGFGPAQGQTNLLTVNPRLPFYSANYTSLGVKPLPFNIVGTDPSLGAATTVIPTVIVPLKFIFPNAPSLPLDGTSVVPATVNSPMFLTADYTTGGTDIGVTQYGDAIQRAEFWNLAGFSQDYHVLLGAPTIAPTVTFTVPTGDGALFRLRNGGFLGVLRDSYFEGTVLGSLLPSYTANMLPIFVTDNVFLSPAGGLAGCCVLGFHNSQMAPIATAKTWIYTAFTEEGTFRNDAILDVQPLSHEVSEWLNDPFVGAFPGGINLVAPYVLPGFGGQCQINYETGDVLEAPPVVFTKTTNGTLYHLQDEAFVTYFLHTTPSFSVNGFYSFLGTFTSFSKLCGPG